MKRGKIVRGVFVALGIIVLMLFVAGMYNSFKELPDGLSIEKGEYRIDSSEIHFLSDITYNNFTIREIEREHQIFDKIFEMISDAESYVLIDMFLMGNSREGYRPLSLELAQNLVDKKQDNPDMPINFVTDEYNLRYWSYEHPELELIENSGVNVIYTDMTKLRDSNVLYSPFWRLFVQPLGIPENFSCEDSFYKPRGKYYCVRSVLRMANAKANHRKVVVSDALSSSGEVNERVLVTSANPDDWGSGYSNVGLYFEDAPRLARDIYFSEKSIADFSHGDFEEIEKFEIFDSSMIDSGDASVSLLTEGKIKDNLIEALDSANSGEKVQIVMFLLTEEEVKDALVRASDRGVEVEIILDPSQDLFMRDSKGIPNCPAAQDLVSRSDGEINVRWYNSGNQQFHSKMVVIYKNDGRVIVFLGSANLTRRNLDDLNIEMHVKVNAPVESQLARDIQSYFARLWYNGGSAEEPGVYGSYTIDFEDNECGLTEWAKYKFQEASGLSAF